jgi:type IV pilus assembly protein PilW
MIPMRIPMKSSQSGFTMVELMVGVLVGLIATVVMFQVFAVSEGQKRTTTSAGDAQQSGLASLYQMERDARMAGFGLNLPALLGCNTNGYSEEGGANFTLKLAPVSIANGATATDPDRVTILYGSSNRVATSERLTRATTATGDNYVVRNGFGFELGDVIVVGEAGKDCTVAQVSAMPSSYEFEHKSGSYLVDGNSIRTRYNTYAAAPNYSPWIKATNLGSRILNLGRNPSFATYAINNGQLVVLDATNARAAPVVIADNIVQLQAQYAFDSDGDGAMKDPTNVTTVDETKADQWADAAPATLSAQGWSRIIGVRMAVVARSVQPERPDPATNECTATTTATMPRWYARDSATPYLIDISASATDWKCYRYRVFEVTIPIRNVAWFADESM